MLEIFFHMSFAFVILAGVVYFPIFSWLKMQQPKEGIDYQSEPLKHLLKTYLARTF